jgi:hypothetical protein
MPVSVGCSSGIASFSAISGDNARDRHHSSNGTEGLRVSTRDERETNGGVCNFLRQLALRGISRDMAFIVLRRSRNTRSYYLVESYRDDRGKTRRRTICHLGREQDATDTLAKALAHWEQIMTRATKELRKARGERRQVVRRRIESTRVRLGVITQHMERLTHAEVERRKREQQAEEAIYWQSFERLRRHPSEENAIAAKRAFLFLAKRHHPDQGGSHHDSVRLKDARVTCGLSVSLGDAIGSGVLVSPSWSFRKDPRH